MEQSIQPGQFSPAKSSQMYKKVFLVFLLPYLFLFSRVKGQKIILTDPTNKTWVDSVQIKWTITEPAGAPQKEWLVWTYVSGPYPQWVDSSWMMILGSKSLAGSFYCHPAQVLPNANIDAVSPGNAIPDGVWKVTMCYLRPPSVGTDTIRSAPRTAVTTITSTWPPTLISPATGIAYTSPFNVHYTLPGNPLAGSVVLQFQGTDTAILSMNNSTSVSFNLKTRGIASSSRLILSTTKDTLRDGLYSVMLSYRDKYGHPADSIVDTQVLIQTATPRPTILYPDSGTVFTTPNPILVKFRLPFPSKSGFETVTFNPGKYTYTPVWHGSLTDSLLVPSTDTRIPDGKNYSVIFSYRDSLGNPAASDTVNGITVHRKTVTPSLTNPAAKTLFRDSTLVKYNLNGIPDSGTVKLVFLDSITSNPVDSVWLRSAAQTASVFLHSEDLAALGNAALDTLPEGTYKVYISCQDTLGNPPASSAWISGVTCQRHTSPPILQEPAEGQTYTLIPVRFALPEAPKGGSVLLVFNGPNTIRFTMANGSVNPAAKINPFVNPKGKIPFTNGVSNSTGRFIPNGKYQVILTYQDNLGNAIAGDTIQNMTVDSGAVLPVSLAGFTAAIRDQAVWLQWYTASETNNAFFQVQQSAGGFSFVSVGMVPGAGNSTEQKTYQWSEPLSKIALDPVYFRLRQVDFDGNSSYSNVIELEIGDQSRSRLLTPNPSGGKFLLRLSSAPQKPLGLAIYNQTGGLVFQARISGMQTPIDLSGEPRGLYLVRLTYPGGKSVTLKALLQ